MKQEQLIAYSLILFILIPLVITTLGGMMILSGSANFFPYAKFLIGLTVSLGLLLFILKNFKMLYGWGYILIVSIFQTFTLRHSFLFSDVSFLLNLLLVIVFLAGISLCIRYIFLNKDFRSIRTLTFSLSGAVVFTVMFSLLLIFTDHHITKNMFYSDFGMGFMLFAVIGIGFLLTDIVVNAIASRYHLKPDLLTVDPIDEDADDDDDDAEVKNENHDNNIISKDDDEKDPS